MERELIAALLLDDKLGNLSDTSSNLLTRFIDGNYEYEILANEINQTVSAVERSLAGDHTFELPPLKFQTAHTINKTALRLFATAALVLFAISLLYLWPDNTSPAVKPQVGQVASVSSLPQPESLKAMSIWHNKEFRLDRLPESTLRNKAHARELVKKYNIKGVLL